MKRVAIIGTAPSCRDIAPFDDPSWDIWACSPGNMNALKRVTIWFELHAVCAMVGEENKSWSIPYFAWLRAQQFPIYMQEKQDYVPQAIVFPYKQLIEHFKTRNWFTSSPAWMLALAIYQKVDEIGIFGIDMANPEEHYGQQKSGLIYWMEKARELGIEVTVPLESCLGSNVPLYGYYEASRMGRRLEVLKLQAEQAKAQHVAGMQNNAAKVNFYDGAIEQLKYMLRTFADGKDDAEIGPLPVEIVERYAERNKTFEIMQPAQDQSSINPASFEEAPSGLMVPKIVATNGTGGGIADLPPAEPSKRKRAEPKQQGA